MRTCKTYTNEVESQTWTKKGNGEIMEKICFQKNLLNNFTIQVR